MQHEHKYYVKDPKKCSLVEEIIKYYLVVKYLRSHVNEHNEHIVYHDSDHRGNLVHYAIKILWGYKLQLFLSG